MNNLVCSVFEIQNKFTGAQTEVVNFDATCENLLIKSV